MHFRVLKTVVFALCRAGHHPIRPEKVFLQFDVLVASGGWTTTSERPRSVRELLVLAQKPCKIWKSGESSSPQYSNKNRWFLRRKTKKRPWRNWIAHRSSEPRVRGSNPFGCTFWSNENRGRQRPRFFRAHFLWCASIAVRPMCWLVGSVYVYYSEFIGRDIVVFDRLLGFGFNCSSNPRHLKLYNGWKIFA